MASRYSVRRIPVRSRVMRTGRIFSRNASRTGNRDAKVKVTTRALSFFQGISSTTPCRCGIFFQRKWLIIRCS